MSSPSKPESQPQRVLITGAAGRIATRVIPLLGTQFDLRLTDCQPMTASASPFEQADLIDPAQTVRVVKGSDAIVHLAIASRRKFKAGGERFTPEEGEREHAFELACIDVNVKGTYNLFRAARLAGVRRIVYVSSLTVVLGLRASNGYPEHLTPHPFSLYGCSKLFGEHLAQVYSRDHGMNVICLRLGQPYPFGLTRERERKLIPGTREALLGFEDIAQAIECSLRATHIRFGAYNIVSESAWRNVNISAAARDLGYVPRQFCDSEGRMVPNPAR